MIVAYAPPIFNPFGVVVVGRTSDPRALPSVDISFPFGEGRHLGINPKNNRGIQTDVCISRFICDCNLFLVDLEVKPRWVKIDLQSDEGGNWPIPRAIPLPSENG